MGWLSYFLLLIGFAIAMFIYAVIYGILSAIPFIGWVFVLIINPFFMISPARVPRACVRPGRTATGPNGNRSIIDSFFLR